MFTLRTWRGWLLAWGLAFLLAACTGSSGNDTTTTLNPSLPNIINTTTLAVGGTCENGGVHVDWGVDRDGDSVLDADEIAGGGDICNGSAGLTPTVHVDPLASAEQCASGSGQQVTMWVDVNDNGEIDPAEQSSVTYAVVCDGASGFAALVAFDIEAPGGNCPYGGLVILSGQDRNGNGSLDEGDGPISTHYTCNTGGATLVQVPHWQAPWYGYSVSSISGSTWSGVTWNSRAEPPAFETGSEASFFYDSYLLANRTGADQAVDVGVSWQVAPTTRINLSQPLGAKEQIPGDGILRVIPGNSTLYAYPFDALDPLTNIVGWSDHYGEGLSANWLSFTLTPGQTMVLVPSPMGEFLQAGYMLSVAASEDWNATGIGVGNPVSVTGTVAQGAVQRRRISGLSLGATYQAIVTSAIAGDDTTMHTHSGPFADWDCGYTSGTDPDSGFAVNACAVEANSDGFAWLEVLGVASGSPEGGDYTLQLRVLPLSEGPVQLDLGSPWSGTVGPTALSSYVDDANNDPGLLIDTLYNVRLSRLYPAGSVDVTFTEKNEIGEVQGTETCYGQPEDTAVNCSLRLTQQSPYLTIETATDSSYKQGGGTYTIELMPGAEGTADSPFGVSVYETHYGSVDNRSSWYDAPEAATNYYWRVQLGSIAYHGGAESPSLTVTITSKTVAGDTTNCQISGTSGSCILSGMSQQATVKVSVDGSASTHGATYTFLLDNGS